MSSVRSLEYVERLARDIYGGYSEEHAYKAALWDLDLLSDQERAWVEAFRKLMQDRPKRIQFWVYRLVLEEEEGNVVFYPMAKCDTPLRGLALIEAEREVDPDPDHSFAMVDSLTGSCLYDSSDPYDA